MIGYQESRYYIFTLFKHTFYGFRIYRALTRCFSSFLLQSIFSMNKLGVFNFKIVHIFMIHNNFLGPENFKIRTQGTLITHNNTAKDMIRECLPIKCMEATILGIYLTNNIPGTKTYIYISQKKDDNIHKSEALKWQDKLTLTLEQY